MISFSIFIASRIRRTSPSLTACPAVATTSHIVPGIGEEITVEPADGAGGAATAAATGAGAAGAGAAGAGAAGAGAGAASAAGAATGAGAAVCDTGAAVAAPPASSTSTAYVVPFTEILYTHLTPPTKRV